VIIGDSLLLVNQEISWFAEQSLEAGLLYGDWSTCLENLCKLQNLALFDKRILFLQARALCALERYDEAATVLTSLMINSYHSSGLYHCLGSISFIRGRFEESIQLYTKAIERNYGNFIDPSIAENFAGRAQALQALGRTIEAESDLGTVVSLKLFEEARTHYLAGRYRLAEECIDAMPQELAAMNFARTLYTRCLVGEQKYQDAIELASEIVISNEACKSAFYYRAIALFHTAQYEKAVDDLTRIVDDEYGILSVESSTENGGLRICDSIDARLLRAEANSRLGDFVQAMRDLDFIIARRPSIQAYLERSKAAFGLALYRTALGDAESALALNSLSFEAQHQLNVCQLALKRQEGNTKSPVVPYQPGVFMAI